MEDPVRRVNPFGLQLRYFRKDRGVSLRDLSDALALENINLAETVLSAIETGRRGPLTGEQLAALCKCLQLGSEEAAALAAAALESSRFVQIPQHATPRQYRLAHRLVRKLATLSERQITTIHAALDQGPAHLTTEESK